MSHMAGKATSELGSYSWCFYSFHIVKGFIAQKESTLGRQVNLCLYLSILLTS